MTTIQQEEEEEEGENERLELTDLNGQTKYVAAFHTKRRHVTCDRCVQLFSFAFHLYKKKDNI